LTAQIIHKTAKLLAPVAAAALLLNLGGCSLFKPHRAAAKADKVQPVVADDQPEGQVIDPEIARREVKVPKIKTENFEIGAFTGILSTQDLQADLIYGVRAAYHVSEDFFVEGEYARSSVSDEVRRVIGQPFFPKQVIDLQTYGLSVGYNLLPGEVFVGTRYAMTSVLYVLGGVGNTHFNSENFLTYNAGFGLKVLPKDWLAVRLEARDRLWQSDLLGKNKLTNNFELTLGLAAYF
jgi:outer membrane beta-barrel protein